MGDCLNNLRQRASWLESHPLDSKRVVLVIRAEEFVLGQVRFPGLRFGGRDAQVVISQGGTP